MKQTVAKGLRELKYKMFFVVGAVAKLYASNPHESDIRLRFRKWLVVWFRRREYRNYF